MSSILLIMEWSEKNRIMCSLIDRSSCESNVNNKPKVKKDRACRNNFALYRKLCGFGFPVKIFSFVSLVGTKYFSYNSFILFCFTPLWYPDPSMYCTYIYIYIYIGTFLSTPSLRFEKKNYKP